jgi:hypothetical protein
MSGLCARAAFRVASRLDAAGISAVVKLGDVPGGMHCYVEVENYIIDVTCSQFQGPKVLVRSKDRANKGFTHTIYGGNPITFRSFRDPQWIFRHFDRDLCWGEIWSPQPADFKRFNKRNYK